MRVGSLFSGIGGLDLGLSRAGFEIAWQVEIDEYCQKVLVQHWPEVKRHRDIRECGRGNLEAVDLICGGFPCQDISSAGKQAGIEEGKQSRLWREQARIIAELRPRYVLVENVAALLYATKQRNGERREAAITTVLRDLASIGYDACWRVCSAAEFGAPHLRKRVFIVAYLPEQRGRAWRASSAGQQGQASTHSSGAAEMGNAPGPGQQERIPAAGLHAESDTSGPKMADADSDRRRQRQDQSESGTKRGRVANAGEDGECGQMAYTPDARLQERHRVAGTQEDEWGGADHGSARDAESPICGVFNGFSHRLDQIKYRWPAGPGEEQFAWEPPRVIQGKLTHRVARLKGLGNAVLPQIAEAIGYGIKQHAGM